MVVVISYECLHILQYGLESIISMEKDTLSSSTNLHCKDEQIDKEEGSSDGEPILDI